jgi:TRAP-type C4-dicarboxylate transport system substrate-binding protein
VRTAGIAAIAAIGLVASGCAGSAGSSGASGSGGGEGFEFGASQEDVDAVLADLDPVEITYQAGAQSPQSVSARNGHGFKEYVEERSGGKITVDVVWGQAIAGYAEIDDALQDGRVDVSYALPIYNPTEHPQFNALATATAGMPNSPVVGEMVGNAALVELAWNSQELLDNYEEQGLVPLTPMISTGSYMSVCADEGTSLDDMDGRQIRVASVAHEQQVTAMGASPVSMEYVEVFEALQRGTVDCTLAQLLPSAEGGILEVAPHISYSSDEYSLSSRTVGAELAGSSFDTLPLAYQQIIFDAASATFGGIVGITADGNAESVRQAKAAGGTIAPIDEATEEIIGQVHEEQHAAVAEDGLLGDDIAERVQASADKWSGVAADLGLEDQGSFEDLDEWWESGEMDFSPMGEQLYEEAFLEHRPE